MGDIKGRKESKVSPKKSTKKLLMNITSIYVLYKNKFFVHFFGKTIKMEIDF